MRILSIGKTLEHASLEIISIELWELNTQTELSTYDYIIISGGDGSIRRVLKQIHHLALPPFILNPTGSFNVIAKIHHVPKLETVLALLASKQKLHTQRQKVYTLNDEVFLFSAGNMGDLQHIFLSETLRFGILKKGILKYILAFLFLLPLHLIMTPFMLLSKNRFFIFTPASFIKKFGSFYGKVEEMTLELSNNYNHIQLDGDIVTLEERILHIAVAKSIKIVVEDGRTITYFALHKSSIIPTIEGSSSVEVS
ncbi:MAG: diacylglycerol kinase family protein [Sulfurovum sp.]|nr:diacylglycerol kinase family protein [Sulfurovum sp.]